MKSSLHIMSAALLVIITGCGAESKNPMDGYEKGVTPEKSGVARTQQRDECGFSFSSAGLFEVVEGGSFKQEIKVVGMKSFDGNLALQGEPKGMTISQAGSKSIVTYVVPRGLVPKNAAQVPFEFGVLPAEQVGRNIQCISKFRGTITVSNLPKVTIKDAPEVINLDAAAAKSSFSVNGKALGLKSIDNLTMAISFDATLDSSERPILNLTKALEPAKASIAVNPNERMFSIELDPSKLSSLIATSQNARLKKMPEIYAIAVITIKNEESKTTYSKNLVIKVTRTLPVAAPKAAPVVAKAGIK